MADYSPPNTFYSQTYGLFENEDMYKFIGKNGAHFKYLTTKLGLEYIWWKKETNTIELWGPHNKLKNAKKIMEDKMNIYLNNKVTVTQGLQRQNAMSIEDLTKLSKEVKTYFSTI